MTFFIGSGSDQKGSDPAGLGSATQDSRIFSSSFFLGFKVLYLATVAASRGLVPMNISSFYKGISFRNYFP